MDGKIINEALAEIVHLASAAMVADDVKVKEQAVADIVDEIRSVRPALFPSRAKKSKDVLNAEWFRRQYSLCGGLFPISHVRTHDGAMERCVINGRKFSMSLEVYGEIPGAPRNCEIHLHDNDELVARIEFNRGKAIGESVGHAALKAYIKRLSGSNRFYSRGGFLKQAVKRREEAAKAEAAKAESETMTTVGCPSLRPMPINLPSGFDGVEPAGEELVNV